VPGTTTQVLQATGYVTARRQATVSTQITGTLTEVLIEEGDKVERGQVIARLESGALLSGLELARANAAQAAAQVVHDQTQLAQAMATERRQAELVAYGMVSAQAGEQARTAVDAAKAALDARRRAVDAALAMVAQAKVSFGHTEVRAPFAGVVTKKAAQVGEIVSPLSAGGSFTRTGVCTIVDMDSLEVEVDVSEASIGQVHPQMPAEAVLDAYPDWKIAARVIAIVPTADRGKATVKVRVGLDRKDYRIVPEMGVRVTFLSVGTAAGAPHAQPPSGVLVPPQALVEREGRTVVFVVANDRAQQRAVVPRDMGTMKLLPDAVRPGERVVIAPSVRLRDGATVREGTED
ncbi:MAG TPA: efflux RND transporter periplasmic adaptor subunit, partial [Rubrivivax sp.]|nr:efflux RND transporter periplasmic adaptor subunit [Rubrivivax sp.]